MRRVFSKNILNLLIILFLLLFISACSNVNPENNELEKNNLDPNIVGSENKIGDFKRISEKDLFEKLWSEFKGEEFEKSPIYSLSSSLSSQEFDSGKFLDITNNQVSGVQEDDIVKANEKYIFINSRNKIEIISVENKKRVSEIKLDEFETLNSFFLKDSKLILIQRTSKTENKVSEETLMPSRTYQQRTKITRYDISEINNIKKEDEIEFEGIFFQARELDGKLYLITKKSLDFLNPSFPSIYKDGFRFAKPDVNYIRIKPTMQYYTIGVLDVDNFNDLNAKTFLLDYDVNFYMSKNNLYLGFRKSFEIDPLKRFEEVVFPLIDKKEQEIFKKHLQKKDKKAISISFEEYLSSLNKTESENFYRSYYEKNYEFQRVYYDDVRTTLYSMPLNERIFEDVKTTEVQGSPLNQFAFDEFDGTLRLVTSKTLYNNEKRERIVFVKTFNEDLEEIGNLEIFPGDESVKSVRYFEDRAYIVTFREIDPLFVIDLSNKEKPILKGKLKIPGFSYYLHPYGKNYLIGIGNEVSIDDQRTRGVKISLFYVENISNPKEVDKRILASSSSIISYDYKAFYFNPELRILAIPYYNFRNYERERTSSDLILRIEKDGFKEIGDFKIKDSYDNFKRTFILNNTIFALSDYSLYFADLKGDKLGEINKINISKRKDYYKIYNRI